MGKLKEILNKDIKDIFKINEHKKNTINIKKISAVSFDFGNAYTKVVKGKFKGGNLIIEYMEKFKTPRGIMNDGIIDEESMMNGFLSKIVKELSLSSQKTVVSSLSSNIINREITIPKVLDEEIETVVKDQIGEYLPINANDYIVQYLTQDEFTQDGKNMMNIFVVTYPKKMADKYFKLLNDVGLKPEALDTNYDSILKILRIAKSIEGINVTQGINAFIDIGAESVDISIVKDGNLAFNRSIRYAGNYIDKFICEEFECSVIDAEKLKNREITINDSSEKEKLNKIIFNVVDDWSGEIYKIFDFYKNKKGGGEVQNIFLYGGGSEIEDIERYINERINIPVKKIRKLENIILKCENQNDICDYLNAIGALIRY